MMNDYEMEDLICVMRWTRNRAPKSHRRYILSYRRKRKNQTRARDFGDILYIERET